MWLHDNYPRILEVFGCTPVAQPDDAGIIAMLKGDFPLLCYIEFKAHFHDGKSAPTVVRNVRGSIHASEAEGE
jgi:hypothetical protein